MPDDGANLAHNTPAGESLASGSASTQPAEAVETGIVAWLAAFLVRRRTMLLLLGIALGLACYFLAPPPQYDRSIENMFAPDDPVRMAYERLTRRFAANEIVLAVYTDPRLLETDGSGFQTLAIISERLRGAPGVRDVLSLSEVDNALRRIDFSRIISGDKTPALLANAPLPQSLLSLFEGMTHGADGKTVGIVCLLEPRGETPVDRQRTVESLRAIMHELPEGALDGMVTGEPVMVADGFRFVEQDGQRLARVSTVLIAICIAFLFRTLRWMLILLAVVQLAILLCHSFVATTQFKLTLVSSMTAAILTVIAVAALVHIIVGFRRELASGADSESAMRQTIRRLAAPIFWSAVTDAVGFASLMISSVGPVQDYGWIMAIGSILVLPAIWLVTPGLALLGRWDRQPHRVWGESHLDDSLALSSQLIARYPRRTTLLAFAIAVFCCVGVTRLELETDFTRSFRCDNPIVQAYSFVEENLGGAGVWDISLPAPTTVNAAYLKRVTALEAALRQLEVNEQPGFTKVISLADAVGAAAASPSLRWAPTAMRVEVMSATMPAFFDTLRTSEVIQTNPPRQRSKTEGGDGSEAASTAKQAWIRVMLRSHERQPAEQKQELIRRTREVVAEHFPGDAEPAGEVAGFFVLLSELVQGAIRDQWRCFAASLFAMGLVLTLALRSVKYAAMALFTNATPVLAVLGLVGWFGVRVNLGVAMIAAVSLGLSVDSSLHFLFDYKRRRSAGADVAESLRQVQQSVGRAMLFATLSLVTGFLVLTTSPFIPTVTFGYLAALSMVGGVIGNLIVLPLLLLLTEPQQPLKSAAS